MKRWRGWALFMLLYVGVDFCDPSIPGVFFFDSSNLFMDGIVQAKALDSPAKSLEPSPARAVDGTVTPLPAPRIVFVPADGSKSCWWRPMKRGCLLSSAAPDSEDD